jgi:hypothetical protein
MSKKFTLYLFSILSISVVTVWAADKFIFSFLPPKLDNPFLMLLSAIGFIASVVGAIEAFQYIGEMLFPPKPAPSEEDKLRQKLRELPWSISTETAKEYTDKILGGRSADFWMQIEANRQNVDALKHLTADPFMLEGLLSVYRNEQGILPKNIGALLDKLLRTQWTPEKIKVKKWLKIDDLIFSFGELVIKTAPEVEYPEKSTWEEAPPRYWKGPYIEMLRRLGALIIYNRRKGQWLNIVISGSWNLFWVIIFLPINLLFVVVKYIFRIAKWWDALEFFRNSSSYFDNLKFTHRIQYAEATRLLLIAEKAHLVERSKKSIRFKHKVWVDYFAAQHITRRGNIVETLKKKNGNRWHAETWKRLNPKRDGIAIALCGITENPAQFIQELKKTDSLLATKCIRSGIEKIPEKIQEDVREISREIIADVQNAGEDRSYDFAKEYLELWNDPSDTNVILDAIQKIEPVTHISLPLAKLIPSTYGASAVEILLRRLKTAKKELKHIVLILGWLRDQRAIKPLQDLAISSRSKTLSLAVLAICFNDKVATLEFSSSLFFEKGPVAGKELWYKLVLIGDDAILWGIKAVLAQEILDLNEWQKAAGMCVKMCQSSAGSQMIGNFLLQNLEKAQHPEKVKFILSAFGSIEFQGAHNKLVEYLSSLDSSTRIKAIESLGKIKDQRAVRPLIGQLYSTDIFIVLETIRALKNLKSPLAINALSERLYDDDVNQDEPFKFGNHPVSMKMIDALIEIDTPKALRKATEWCEKQLGNQQSAYYAGMQPSLSNVVEYYLEFKIETREAYEIFRAWKEKKDNNKIKPTQKDM